jgi:hypothetical protein
MSAKVADPTSADEAGAPSIDALIEEILENPERVNGADITPEQIFEIQKRLNPYQSIPGVPREPERLRAVAAAYTNLRADYLQRLTMTALVGFLFRVHDEWEVPAEARRWRDEEAAEAAKGPEPTPWTPEDIAAWAGDFHSLAQSLLEASAAAAEKKAAAEQADQAYRDAAALEGETAGAPPAAAAGTAVAAAERVKALQKAAHGAFSEADTALEKARGIQYATMYMARQIGQESDKRIDAFAKIAGEHEENRKAIASCPIVRPDPAQREIPAAPAKKIIENFLRAWFEYNPDAHVRSAYDQLRTDQRVLAHVEGLGEVVADAGDPSRLPLEVIQAARPKVADADRADFDALTSARETYRAAVALLREPTALAALRRATESEAGVERFRRYLFPLPKESAARAAVDVIPPQDTFHRWRYYTEVNYEELRTATQALYHDRPDLDWAISIGEYFEGTPEEVHAAFEKFRDRYQDEVVSDIKVIELGGWTLLGDFKSNRGDKITFFNKNTDVLKRILDRHTEDKKLGEKLMKKRILKHKAKNIREAGPDHPGLADYAKEAGAKLGAEKVIKRADMLRLERAQGDLRRARELEFQDECAKTIRELSAAAKVRDLLPEEERQLKDAQKGYAEAEEILEIPDDMIQTNVHVHDTKTGEFSTRVAYIPAEAPEHLRAVQEEQEGAGASQERAGAAAQQQSVAPAPARSANLAPAVAQMAPFAQAFYAKQLERSRKGEPAELRPDDEVKYIERVPIAEEELQKLKAASAASAAQKP